MTPAGFLLKNACFSKELNVSDEAKTREQLLAELYDLRKRVVDMEEMLRENEERYGNISSSISDFAFSYIKPLDGDYAIDWLMGAVERITGFSTQGVLKRGSWRFLVHAEDLPIFDRNVMGLEPGDSAHCVLRLLHRDGSTRWIRASTRAVESSGLPGQRRLFGSCEDITERKRAEDDLRNEEHKYRVLFEAANDGIFLHGTTGFVDCNEKGASMYGLTKEEVIGRSPAELSPVRQPDGRLSSEVASEKMLSALNGAPQSFVWQSLNADGAPFDVEITLNRVEIGDDILMQAIVRDITERRRVEEALRRSEEEKSAILNGLKTILIEYLDPQMRIIWANGARGKAVGEALENLKGKHCYEAIGGLNSPCEGCTAARALRTRKIEEGEFTTSDGRTLLFCSSPVMRNLEVAGVVHVAVDISERKHSEEKLLKLNRKLSAIIECNHSLIRSTDEQTLLNDICRIICEAGGYRMAWVGIVERDKGKSVKPVAWAGAEDGYLDKVRITWADTERGRGPTGTSIRTCAPIVVRYDEHHLDLTPWRAEALKRGYVSAIALPLLINGEALGSLSIYSSEPKTFDAEEVELLSQVAGNLAYGIEALRRRQGQEEAEKTLQESEERLRTLINSTPDIVCFKDAEGRWMEANHTNLELFELTGVDYTGKNDSELAGLSECCRDALLASEKTDEWTWQAHESTRRDEIIPRPDGTTKTFDMIKVPLYNEDGSRKGLVVLGRDVTERKRAEAEKEKREAQLRQTQKLEAIGILAGGIAHDFNNLLMAILGNIQLMIGMIQDEKSMRRLQNMEKVVHDGANMVKRLLRFTTRDRDIHVIQEATDVNEAINDTVELTRPRWKHAAERYGHKVGLKLDLEPHCLVRIEASDIREILMNLIFNALDAMPLGGTITIKSRCLVERVTIEVADTGIGMSEGVSKRIFDPFYTTKGVENSGLGLSVCWSLVTRAGGELRVESEQGEGSVFLIGLPRAGTAEEVSSSPQSREWSGSRRILLVEDNVEVLGIIRDMLCLKGHSVAAESHGSDALKRLEGEEFDCVITDLGMPDVGGWDVATKAKARRPEIPVIMITGWGEQFEGEDLSRRGVDMVLAKPVSSDKLFDALNRMFEAVKVG